jgi:hypothetical protein
MLEIANDDGVMLDMLTLPYDALAVTPGPECPAQHD